MVALVHFLVHTPLPELVSWHTLPLTGSPKSVSNATIEQHCIQSAVAHLKSENNAQSDSTVGGHGPGNLTVGAREGV